MRLIDAESIQYEPMLSAKGNGMYEDVMVAYKSQIDGLPTIEERKKGKWIEVTDHEIPIVCKCSVCEWRTKDYDWFDYCPNCGADMREDNT